ncbi:MAG TPA: FlgD immunoglobulin-like domain containing protein, partial [Candidatus Kapabacteria bacterium]|nr:FlgD immunoglobulin-like domain containing protein [Candidatus Kapabacteria bacterium]
NPGSAVYVIPISPSNGALVADQALFIAPFILDPNDQTKMYFPTLNRIWRNNDLLNTTSLFGVLTVTSDWDSLASSVTTDTISTVAVSTTPANRLYYGTVNGKVYRMDGANTGQPASVDVSTGKGFPAGAYVSSIAVDPQNADNAIVVFANYHVQSLFYTSDGGTTWAPIGGNLEQNSDGSGDGPSCRWASVVRLQSGVVYLVGTSTGLYSTSYLNGTSTTWYKEGASTIGNAIVDMMDVRQSDGMVAVASHGSGMYSGVISSPDAVSENAVNPNTFTLLGNTPNPFSSSTNIQYSLQQPGAVTLRIYDQLGKEVQTIASGEQSAGVHTVEFDPSSELPGGVYYYRLESGRSVSAKQMMLIK